MSCYHIIIRAGDLPRHLGVGDACKFDFWTIQFWGNWHNSILNLIRFFWVGKNWPKSSKNRRFRTFLDNFGWFFAIWGEIVSDFLDNFFGWNKIVDNLIRFLLGGEKTVRDFLDDFSPNPKNCLNNVLNDMIPPPYLSGYVPSIIGSLSSHSSIVFSLFPEFRLSFCSRHISSSWDSFCSWHISSSW